MVGHAGEENFRHQVTFFTTPKAFEGKIAIAQQNAIHSWRKIADVVLIGDEPGIQKLATELGVNYVPNVAKNENGTPLLSSAFELARSAATTPYLIYCNCDIILFDDFESAVQEIIAMPGIGHFLATSQRTTALVSQRIDFDDEESVARLKNHARKTGKLDSLVCKELFVFPRELYKEMPAFAVGRGNWDNWMVHNAKQNQVPVISLTDRILTLHQEHDHTHAGNRYSAYVSGTEARTNQRLANGRHLISGSTPDFFLADKGLRPARMQCINGEFWMDFPRFMQLLLNFVGLR